ncbi:MAG TPA: hypothetical protein VF181_02160 [Balneolaceae bacterium]
MKLLEVSFEGGSFEIHKNSVGHFYMNRLFSMMGENSKADSSKKSLYKVLSKCQELFGNWWNLYPLHVDESLHEYISFQISKGLKRDNFNLDNWKSFGINDSLPESTLKDLLWDGESPYCKLHGYQVPMRLNDQDFFECPVSGLQICRYGPIGVILNKRGKGHFKKETIDAKGVYLYPQSINKVPFFKKDKSFSGLKGLTKQIKNIRDD